MSVIKCKMCGGEIEFEQGATVGTCKYCGTKQTLPKLDDDRRSNLYDRASHFRRNNDFDKASSIYEQILTEDTTDAEAYWSLVLCRYGIEYVEDPATHKRVPTVNRAQFTSIFDDDNYKSAVRYADSRQRELYEEEAKEINEIQKGILAISQNEEPFDVFICYKETDNNGRRTPDSVLANDLYHQLTQEGFKVFFARITLEDKLGTAYEPYIFAALNSAKVMVVLGTRAEYFNAPWVKNEWSRYLALIRTAGGMKVLIPAYRDMDPYDLPDEFSHLQALDMSKLGFMQDLIRGIKKLTQTDEPKTTVKETVTVVSGNANVAPLLERAFLFLEDGKWQDADIYCEKVLDIDPKNAEAYLGKLMAELHVRTRKQLADCAEPFDDRENYGKVIRFGDEKLEAEMRGYITHINERNEAERLTRIYNSAVSAMKSANSETAFKSAANKFRTIPGFKDADALAEQCLEKANVCRKDAVYTFAVSQMAEHTVNGYEAAIRNFRKIPGWKDADKQIIDCHQKIEEIKAKEEADRIEAERKAEELRIKREKAAKKRKKIAVIVTLIIVACVVFVIMLTTVIIPRQQFKEAVGKHGDSIKSASVGDTIRFGHYKQNDSSNSKEEIEWIVLDKHGNSLLLISKYALDCQVYNKSYTSETWETCSLRKWLNETFIITAFNSAEQKIIKSTAITESKNPKYSTYYLGSNNTIDKIFLLSTTEVNKYFSSDSARQCQGTTYCYTQGAYKANNGNCCWWLRSPGHSNYFVSYVNSDGSVDNYGSSTYFDLYAVRPAMWIGLGD